VQPTPTPAPVQAFAPDFSRRLRLILTTLAALIARRFLREPRLAALIVPLWSRLQRAARRFERLMARLTAGRLPKPHRSGPGGPHRAAHSPPDRPHARHRRLRPPSAPRPRRAPRAPAPRRGRLPFPRLHLVRGPHPAREPRLTHGAGLRPICSYIVSNYMWHPARQEMPPD